MQFKGLELDPFQIQAIHYIKKNFTVVVSAATGTGKTVLAEFIIDTCLQRGNGKIVYTAPIKALSNQKFRDFTAAYGEKNIGLLTGDIVIRPHAPILIMTTEIYRNMLLARDPIIQDISYVVFDEIHFMNDLERGRVWEESILFSPSSTRFLCLSATIPNAEEFAAWLRTLKDHSVETVTCHKRAVPLHPFLYDFHRGFIERSMLRAHQHKHRSRKKQRSKIKTVTASRVVLHLGDKLPAIVFSFSRKQCEQEAKRLLKLQRFPIDASTRTAVLAICSKYFSSEIERLPSTQFLLDTLLQGIGFHHAGLLPQQRHAVEELFGQGCVKVLFATETFAVGINMPAKTVILNGLRKFDGQRFRLLTSKEYFQLAGRAGRRGIDKEGFVVSLLGESETINDYLKISHRDTEPIQSQFQLSYNTILNMLDMYTPEEIDRLLRQNFYAFRKQHRYHRQVRMKTSFSQKCKQLQIMRYLTRDNELNEKGRFAKNIYFEELLISELFATPLYKEMTDTELLQVITGIVYERRPNDHFSFHGISRSYQRLISKARKNLHFFNKLNKLSLKRMMALVDVWSSGGDFQDILTLTTYREGDVVRLFRRVIDMLQQIRRATDDEVLIKRLLECQERIDRDLVAVDFV
jgi:superfamily II RNA helicase